jgi:3-methyl-2-oxobutanoate hydroxymethyltransferase
VPRHAKVYRNFAAENDRLQRERIAAFSELVRDIETGAYPEARHLVDIPASELRAFLREIGGARKSIAPLAKAKKPKSRRR